MARQRASFDGIEFPVTRFRVRGTYRDHTHEYLKTDGGANEKFGRSVYTVEMDAEFHSTLLGYPGLYPDALTAIRKRYEAGKTAPLVIPTIGTLQAYQLSWDQGFDAKVQSGESVPLHFKEDSNEAFLTAALTKIDTGSIDAAAARLDLATAGLWADKPRPSLFDQIQDGANKFFAIRDQVVLYDNLIAGHIEGLVTIVQEADKTIEALQHPENFPIIEALHDLQDALMSFARTATLQSDGPRIFTVDRTMTVAQISSATYGDATHGIEIMQNNMLEDPLAVPAGTPIIWFPSSGLLAA
jgi:hypothetical protein